VVPKDAFEKLMWIDSDRFGYMINTVSEGTLEREKQVVKNEKRQRVDNRPYGHTDHVIRKALYPKSHPYNWTVIGDLKDLQNATLQDVREFYDRYYIPANATLVIAGDIDIAKTKDSVQQWFGEIKKSPAIKDLTPQRVILTKSKKVYHEDNFAKLPEIRLTFPTVEQYSKDSYALAALGSVLSSGKQSPLFSTIVKEQKLAPSVSAYQSSNELAGTFTIRIRANAGIDLDTVETAINQALQKFEHDGVRDNDLIKIKARQETDFYNGVSSVINKAFQLGLYSEYAGDPAFIKKDISNILAVTKEDIIRVYHKYIKDKPAIITSFVPKDKLDLIVKGSVKAKIVEEKITQGAENKFKEDLNPIFTKTPSKLDRSEPPLSDLPVKAPPTIWHHKTENGITITGIEQHELPLIEMFIRIEGGLLLDESSKLGTANLLAAMMNEGSKFKTPTELEDAIGALGSSIYFSSSKTASHIYLRTLKRNYQKTMDLVKEMLMHPRFDEADFERLKKKRLTTIKANLANPNRVASSVFSKKLYGDKHIFSHSSGGNAQTVTAIELKDVIDYYKNNLSLKNTSLQIAGDYQQQEVLDSLQQLDQQWSNSQDVSLPKIAKTVAKTQAPKTPKIYFIDFPGSKQSVIYLGKTTVNAMDEDFNKLTIVNNRLGSGSSARLTQILRIEKGYTYGATSFIRPSKFESAFVATTQVRSNVTLESLQILKDQIDHYDETFSAEELSVTKNLILKGNSKKYETLRQLLSIASSISQYGYDDDYIQQYQQELQNLSLDEARKIIKDNIDEEQMIYVIVGDATTQFERIKQLGYGDPIKLDSLGNEI
jgi:zinc protease